MATPNEQRRMEKLTLGQYLASIRNDRQMTLREVEEATNKQVSKLRPLSNNNWLKLWEISAVSNCVWATRFPPKRIFDVQSKWRKRSNIHAALLLT